MHRLIMLSWIVVLGVAGCSSTDTGGSQGTTDAAHDSPADGGNDAVSEASPEAGPCEPLGSWLLHYAGDAGTEPDEKILVETSVDAGPGEPHLTFLDRVPEKDSCSYPGDGGQQDASASANLQGSATLDGASCTLTGGYYQTWCMSGEDQCDKWTLTLTLTGTKGSGVADWKGGWCMDQHTSQYLVTATKQ